VWESVEGCGREGIRGNLFQLRHVRLVAGNKLSTESRVPHWTIAEEEEGGAHVRAAQGGSVKGKHAPPCPLPLEEGVARGFAAAFAEEAGGFDGGAFAPCCTGGAFVSRET
jgi:hypothetical protein